MPRHLDAGDRGVCHQRQALVRTVISHHQDTHAAAIDELIGDEVERPAVVGPLRDEHRRPRADRPLASSLRRTLQRGANPRQLEDQPRAAALDSLRTSAHRGLSIAFAQWFRCCHLTRTVRHRLSDHVSNRYRIYGWARAPRSGGPDRARFDRERAAGSPIRKRRTRRASSIGTPPWCSTLCRCGLS